MLFRCYVAALIAFVLLLSAAFHWQGEKQTPESLGRFTARQVLSRAEALSDKLGPQASGLQFTLSVQNGHSRWGPRPYLHCVEGRNQTRELVAYFILDGDTGDLMGISQPVHSVVPDGEPIRSPEDAVTKARYWLDTLGVSKLHPIQRLNGRAKKLGRTWCVRFKHGDFQTSARVDANTGDLRYFNRTWSRISFVRQP